VLQRVDGTGEAALDQISVRRSLSSGAEAANEMICGNADELREIGDCDVAVDIGVDVSKDLRQVSRR
jgi:hypothetical protein